MEWGAGCQNQEANLRDPVSVSKNSLREFTVMREVITVDEH